LLDSLQQKLNRVVMVENFNQLGVVQVVALLPCKSEVLSSNPSTAKKKNSQKEIFRNLASVCKHDFILLLVSQGTSLSYFAPLYEKGIFE
jgi:signal-transduction protein with cAMP-binding, CBS, and nucleotidyltransferase domain